MAKDDPPPNPDPEEKPKPVKDPASVGQLDRIESGIGEIKETVKRGKPKEEPPPATIPDGKTAAANDDSNSDELDDFIFPKG
jgi:hypothetical protein